MQVQALTHCEPKGKGADGYDVRTGVETIPMHQQRVVAALQEALEVDPGRLLGLRIPQSAADSSRIFVSRFCLFDKNYICLLAGHSESLE